MKRALLLTGSLHAAWLGMFDVYLSVDRKTNLVSLFRCASRAYISDCHTAMFQWHLISSFYDYLPWARCGVAVANTPWSGSYEITSPTWALAHTTQFADIGWRFARHDGGVGFLSKGGSYVTRVAPGSTDMSIVVEKMTHDSSNCARGNNPGYNTAAENVTFILKGSFANVTSLNVWYSNLTDGNDSSQLFIKKGPIPVTNGRVTISVAPGDIFTLTTLTRGNKGSHTPPGPSTFPLPYTQNFDDETVPAPPRIWYDQMGAWQVYPDPRGSGNVMRQMVPVWPECWGYVALICLDSWTHSLQILLHWSNVLLWAGQLQHFAADFI